MPRLIRIIACLALAASAVLPIGVSAQERQGSGTSPGRYVILGCVSRQAAVARGAPTYLLTDTRGEKPMVYRLDGEAAALEFHVGHFVEIAGSLSTPARGGVAASASALVMKVERLSYLSKNCPSAKPAGK
jgi:hypothetical protein